MRIRKLQSKKTTRNLISVFGGLDMRERIPEGALADEKNVSAENYPVLSIRDKRATVKGGTALQGMAAAGEDFYLADNGALYRNGAAVEGVTLTPGEKSMIAVGGKLLIFPDMISYAPNAEDEEKKITSFATDEYSGSLHIAYYTSETISADGCDTCAVGTPVIPWDTGEPGVLEYISASADRTGVNATAIVKWEEVFHDPDETTDGDAYTTEEFVSYPINENGGVSLSVMTRLYSDTADLSTLFFPGDLVLLHKPLDGVRETQDGVFGYIPFGGLWVERLYMRVIEEPDGIPDEDVAKGKGILLEGYAVCAPHDGVISDFTISRRTPVMDKVGTHGNRLWGCRYGLQKNDEGKEIFVNEIYASELGNERNWKVFDGTAADSYVATIPAEGKFTAMTEYGGYLLAFKENCMILIAGNKPSNYQVQIISCAGVEDGSSSSLVNGADGALYYKAQGGIYKYDGSMPYLVSAEFGTLRFGKTVAGTLGTRLFFSLSMANGRRRLMVYDTERRLWCAEDEGNVTEFLPFGGNLLYREGNVIGVVRGSDTGGRIGEVFTGTIIPEGEFDWMAEFGDFDLNSPNAKYVSRLQLRMTCEPGACVEVAVKCDSGRDWQTLRVITAKSKESVCLPVVTPRCDHYRIRLQGRGKVTLWTMARDVEESNERR